MQPQPLAEASSLHVCNLANVAYGYCKILNAAGHPVELRCHDLNHVMSQPEWDDLDLPADLFPDEGNFYANSADLRSYCRPPWFRSGPLLTDLKVATSPIREPAEAVVQPRSAFERAQRLVLERGWDYASRFKTRIPYWAKARLAPRVLEAMIRLGERPASVDGSDDSERLLQGLAKRIPAIAEQSQRYGPEWAVSLTEVARYRLHAHWLALIAARHPVVVSYVLSPIYALLLGARPSISVEIGTMREIPFDGSFTGRLLALAYRQSDMVLITNPDVRTQAETLGLERYRFCPHPVDETVYRPNDGPSELKRELLERHDADFIAFAPARQNWRLKGNDRYLQAMAALMQQGLKVTLLIPAWGQEIERSKALCRELGIERRVVWLPPQSERGLVKYYQASDFVLDQFTLGVFGLTTPKAMAAGAVVLTSYNAGANAWCFPQQPPLVPCESAREIAEAIAELAQNDERRRAIAHESRLWILRWHARPVVARILLETMQEAKINFGRRQT